MLTCSKEDASAALKLHSIPQNECSDLDSADLSESRLKQIKIKLTEHLESLLGERKKVMNMHKFEPERDAQDPEIDIVGASSLDPKSVLFDKMQSGTINGEEKADENLQTSFLLSDRNIGIDGGIGGDNAVLAEPKAGLAGLRAMNDQLRDNLLQLNGVHSRNQKFVKAHSLMSTPLSKRHLREDLTNVSELKAYIYQLHEIISDLLLRNSQERQAYIEKINILELSLSSAISKYESKLQAYKKSSKLNPLILKELKAINELNRAFNQKETMNLSQEEMEVMQALKDLSQRQDKLIQLNVKNEYTDFNLSPHTSSNCHKSLPSFEHCNILQLSRREPQNVLIACEANDTVQSEGPTREQINNLSKNLFSKINVLESVHQKENDLESQYLLHRKKQELVLNKIRDDVNKGSGRKVLGVKEANKYLGKDISSQAFVDKENTSPIRKFSEASREQVHQLEQEISSLKAKLAASERRLITKTFECEEAEGIKFKEKEIEEKKRIFAIETKRLALMKRLVDFEQERIKAKKHDLGTWSGKIISVLAMQRRLLSQSCYSKQTRV